MTAALTLDQPLAPNLSLQDVQGLPGYQLTISDGHQQLAATEATTSTVALVSTDQNGNIIGPWALGVNFYPNNGVATVNWPGNHGVGDSGTLSAHTPFDEGYNLDSPGSWETNPPTITISALPDTHLWANGHQSTTLTVSYAPNANITLSVDQPDGIVAQKVASDGTAAPYTLGQPVATDDFGQALFKVTSTTVHQNNDTFSPVTFTAADADHPATQATTDVTFEAHKIIVQIEGINTALDCVKNSCTDDPSQPGSDNMGFIRTLLKSQGFVDSDFLWYSYKGGHVGAGTNYQWWPNSYLCQSTAQSYDTSILALYNLLFQFGSNNPNTQFYVVGHSQGGLIAFQALGFKLPPKTKLAVFTMDAPLGGAPQVLVTLAAAATCWNYQNGRAPAQLVQLYKSVSTTLGHLAQGSNAQFLLAPNTTNSGAVSAAAAKGINVYTFGSLDDATYNPSKCNVQAKFLGGPPTDDTSTEVVSTAGGSHSLENLDNDTPYPPPITGIWTLFANRNVLKACVRASHGAVMWSKAPAVASAIQKQYQ